MNKNNIQNNLNKLTDELIDLFNDLSENYFNLNKDKHHCALINLAIGKSSLLNALNSYQMLYEILTEEERNTFLENVKHDFLEVANLIGKNKLN